MCLGCLPESYLRSLTRETRRAKQFDLLYSSLEGFASLDWAEQPYLDQSTLVRQLGPQGGYCPNSGFLCATSVALSVSVVTKIANKDHHRDAEGHRGCTEKEFRLEHNSRGPIRKSCSYKYAAVNCRQSGIPNNLSNTQIYRNQCLSALPISFLRY